MRATKQTLLLAAALTSVGCWQIKDIDDAGQKCPASDLSASPVDMAAAAPKCAAAKGLPGDNVLCVDFDKITQLSDPALAGWNFSTSMTGNCAGWQISGGKLQVNMFSSLVGSCGITMPAFDLKVPANQKYVSATFSIVHTVDLVEGQQQAQVYLGQDVAGRQIGYLTGKNPRQHMVLTVAKDDFPAGINNVFAPITKLTTTIAGGALGWRIESIAINLN